MKILPYPTHFLYYAIMWGVQPKKWKYANPIRFDVFFSRSTLGKIETTLQIGETLKKVRTNAILNHTHKYKYGYVTKPMRVVE